MKFIRKNGRIIPIRDKSKGGNDSHFSAFAAAGALANVSSKIGRESVTIRHGNAALSLSLQKPKFAAVTAAIGLGVLGANVYDSLKKADKEDSVTSGISRFVGNALAGFGGSFAAGVAMRNGAKIIKKIKPTRIVAEAGDIYTTARKIK